jgi:hypothetical protein
MVTTDPVLDRAAAIRSLIFPSSSSLPRRGVEDLNALSPDELVAVNSSRASPRSPRYGVRAADDSQFARSAFLPQAAHTILSAVR